MSWEEQIQTRKDSFLWHWMKFCESLYPSIVNKNPIPFFLVGCALLTTACKAYIMRNRPMPANFYIVITGSPASGKGRVIDCLRLAIEGTWIEEIATGSAEAIEEEIDLKRVGFMIWDEIGELGEKTQSYLDKVKYVLNRAYYLDSIKRVKTSKRSVSISANSYYLSVIFAGLDEDWKKIEKKYLGGFERRFLPAKMQRARKPFDTEIINEDGKKHLDWIWDFINEQRDKAYLIQPPDLSPLQSKVTTLDEKYWTLVEEYTYKIVAALVLNENILGDFTIKASIASEDQNFLVMLDDVIDVYMMFSDAMMLNLRSESSVSQTSKTLLMFVDAMMLTLKSYRNVADDTLYRLLDRIDEYVKKTGEIVVRKTKFAEEILKITNAQYFSHVLRALKESGKIREVELSPRKKFVVLDPKAPICANCAYFDRLCKLDEPKDALERRAVMELYDPFEKCRLGEFKPLEE